MTIVVLMLQLALPPAGWAAGIEDLPSGKCGVYSLQVAIDAIRGEARSGGDIDQPKSESVDHSLLELSNAARDSGLDVFAVRWRSFPEIPYGDAPAILPIVNQGGGRHFVAALAAQDSQLLICDFPHRPAWVPESWLRDRFHWDGSALHLAQAPEKINRLRRLAWMPRPSSLALVGSSLILLLVANRRRKTARTQPLGAA